MYNSFYGLTAKPFQLQPDPRFFFGSKNHVRAMTYLRYGLSQGEGFIVITGEVGAGKTTLVRNLFREIDSGQIVAAQIVNTHLSSEDTLKMAAAAFGIDFENASKAILLTRIERFLHACNEQGKRALLVVDEAQNLSPQAIEELRMLSNFQAGDHSLLQTFLLGQPEFRKTLMGADMQQLRQRVIASYHLGPMDADETKSYIEHRLHTVGWRDDPHLSDEAFAEIHACTGGIPRKINTFCDRLFLMGCLEELHAFDASHIRTVMQDIQQELEFADVDDAGTILVSGERVLAEMQRDMGTEHIIGRLDKIDRALQVLIGALSKLLFTPKTRSLQEDTK
jgi:general secretion pathway protein A